MAKITETIKAKFEDAKTKHAAKTATRKVEKEANKKFTQDQKDLESALIKRLKTMDPTSNEFDKVQKQLTAISKIHAERHVSADNVCAAVTSVTGVGGAIAYDSKSNFPKLAIPFIGKPGKVARPKAD